MSKRRPRSISPSASNKLRNNNFVRDNTNFNAGIAGIESEYASSASPLKPTNTEYVSVADAIVQSDSPSSISSPVVQVHHQSPIASQILNFFLVIRNFFVSLFTMNLITDKPSSDAQFKYDQMQLDFHKFTKEVKESFELREAAFNAHYQRTQAVVNKIIIDNDTAHSLNQVLNSEKEMMLSRIQALETQILNNAEKHEIELRELQTDCDMLKDRIEGTNELFRPKFITFETDQKKLTTEINQLKVTLNQLSSTTSTFEIDILKRTSSVNDILEEKDEDINNNRINISSNSAFNKQLQEHINSINGMMLDLKSEIKVSLKDIMARVDNIEKSSQSYLKTKDYNEIKAKDYAELKSNTSKSINFVENDLANLKLEIEGLNLKIDNLPKYSPTETKSVSDKSNDNHSNDQNTLNKKQDSINEDDEESLGSADDSYLSKQIVADPPEDNKDKPVLTEINEAIKSPIEVPSEKSAKIEIDDKDAKSFAEDLEVD